MHGNRHASAPDGGIFFLASLIALCSVPALAQNLDTSQQPLRGGLEITGFTGVVDISTFAADGSGGSCTGSMISPNVILTAAHCLNRLGAEQADDGSGNFVISYYDPRHGRRQVFSGAAEWSVLSTYHGTSGDAGGANSDIALIETPVRFAETGYHDYLRLYDGEQDVLYSPLSAYGAGLYTYSGKKDDKLRTAKFEPENITGAHIVVDTRKYVGICLGDSGGPLMFSVRVEGKQVPTVVGVTSGIELSGGEGGNCSNNDWGLDDAFYSRSTWKKLGPMIDAIGLTCDQLSGGSQRYRRCFDIPFIEDVAGEGLDREKALLLAAAAVF